MKIQPAQSVIARSVLTLIFTISLGVTLIAQDASEEPSESVLKEETTAEESADTGNTEPKEFTPQRLLLEVPQVKLTGEFTFKPSTFETLTAGVSTSAEVLEKLGDSRATIETNGSRVTVYSMEPYDRVGIVIKEDVAESIHLHFKQSTELKQLVTEMGLTENAAVTQATSSNKAFLLIWPRAGRHLPLQTQRRIGRFSFPDFIYHYSGFGLYLERGTNRQWFDFAGALSDARAVQALQPMQHDAFILEAQVQQRMGNVKAANAALEKAVELSPGNTELLLMQAGLTGFVKDTSTMLQRSGPSETIPGSTHSSDLGQLICWGNCWLMQTHRITNRP